MSDPLYTTVKKQQGYVIVPSFNWHAIASARECVVRGHLNLL